MKPKSSDQQEQVVFSKEMYFFQSIKLDSCLRILIFEAILHCPCMQMPASKGSTNTASDHSRGKRCFLKLDNGGKTSISCPYCSLINLIFYRL